VLAETGNINWLPGARNADALDARSKSLVDATLSVEHDPDKKLMSSKNK
jgi:hypothetical protein